jgi:hypothetical protein
VSAAQAGALRAAAAFIEDAAVPGVTVAVCGDGEIRIIVDRHAGPAAARVHAVAALAAAAGAGAPSWSSLTRGLHAAGQLGPSRLSITTFIDRDETDEKETA